MRAEIDRDQRRAQVVVGRGRDRAEVEMQVFGLAGPVAAEMGLDAGARGPAEPRGEVDERGGGGSAGRIEARDRAFVVEATERDAAGDIGEQVGRHQRAEAAAQRPEPFHLLARIEARGDRACRIADGARACEQRIAALARELEIGFDARQPSAHLPVVAGLGAAREPIEARGGARGIRERAARGIVEHRVRFRIAEAVADVRPEIEPRPGPGGHEWRLGEEGRPIGGRRLGQGCRIGGRLRCLVGAGAELLR